jgi:hypothetical protein
VCCSTRGHAVLTTFSVVAWLDVTASTQATKRARKTLVKNEMFFMVL